MGKAREVLARKRNSPLNVILRAVAVPRGSLPEQRGPKDLSCSTCGTLTCTAPLAHRTPAPRSGREAPARTGCRCRPRAPCKEEPCEGRPQDDAKVGTDHCSPMTLLTR